MVNSKFGVNISGYINKQFGLGAGVRANINSIKTTSIPFAINDFNIQISEHIKEDLKSAIEVSEKNPYNINLVQINIDRLHSVVQDVDNSYFKNKYNIAFWAWELENFPEESKIFFTLFNEIWVPSNFCTEAISKVSPVPVIKIMHAIDIEKPRFNRVDFGLPEEKFIFLTMFDYYSSMTRKNPIGSIDAYEKTFGINNKDVLLVIKSSLSKEFPKEKKELTDRIGDNRSIIIIEEILEENKLFSLINCCDCFVSLHRSEGFGLTMAEAMFLGKPVIGTAYSANIEFMTINNSFLVKYEMIDTGDNYLFVGGKSVWADPDISHAAELMKFVVENPEEANKIAKKGQYFVKQNLNPKKIGEKIEARLNFINQEFCNNINVENSKAEEYLRFENQLLQQKIDKMKTLFGVQIKLKFKNLQNKIRGRNRKYFWE